MSTRTEDELSRNLRLVSEEEGQEGEWNVYFMTVDNFALLFTVPYDLTFLLFPPVLEQGKHTIN
jgi:hypothetical protein